MLYIMKTHAKEGAYTLCQSKKSLQSSMIMVVGLAILIFAVLTVILTYNNYNKITEESIKATAKNYQEGFEAQLNTQIIEAEAIATDNDILSLLLKKYNDSSVDLLSDTASADTIHAKLEQYASSFGNHVIYSVYDMNGMLVYSSDESLIGTFSHYVEDMSKTLTETQVNPTIELNGLSNGIHIMVPVSVKDKYVVGVIIASVKAEYFGTFISEDTDTYLLDNANNSLMGIDLSNDSIQKAAEECLAQYKGKPDELYGTISTGYFFSKNVYGYSIMPEYHWIYLVEQDDSIYQSLLHAIPGIIIAVIIILLIIVIISSSSLAKKYSTPILDLKEKMLQASQGDLAVHCDFNSKDEFGELATHFNDMMTIISNNYEELSKAKEQLEKNQQELQLNYAQIEELAYTDALTGLSNRLAFMSHAYNVFHSTNKFTKHAILFLDLDNFKNVNDTLGHDYGDLLLKQVALKLSDFMSGDDFLARTGGDEFLVLKNKVDSAQELESFASNLISIAEHPFDLNGETAYISLSVGVAVFPEDGLTANELVKNADIAMYSAKNAGKNAFRFFDSSMEDALNYKNEIEEALRTSIEKKEVYLMYQPQCDMQTGRITGCEALMRLSNSYLGQVSPAEFIPIAEESGIIHELGSWALKTACSFNKQLLDAGLGPLTMSVNASMEQLKDPDFADIVMNTLNETGLEAKYLEIEVTESMLMQDFERNVSLIQNLRNKGIRIALDDFGTGYSSFNYLTKIPIDTLKMDKSFVDNIGTDSKDCYVAETIIQLAHKLHISVVAEGVETTKQQQILKDNDCDILQGYLFSKPLMDSDYQELVDGVNSAADDN